MARTTPPRNPPAPASTRKKPRAATTTRKPNYGKRAARGYPGLVGCPQNNRIKPPHLFLQQPHSVCEAVRPEAVGAHEFG